MQVEFNALAEKTIREAPKKLFHKNGRFIGFSIAATFRKKRKPQIICKMQLTKDSEKHRAEITHKTKALTWAWIRREWIDFYDVSLDERIALKNEIDLAKSIYEVDINRAIINIAKQANSNGTL